MDGRNCNFKSLTALIIALALTGCGGSEFDLAPVSGVVLLDGKPVPGATVVFQPKAKSGSNIAGQGSTGTCDAEGRFELALQTREREPGAVVGGHTVRIYSKKSDQPSASDVDVAQEPELFPNKYNSRTELIFEVPTGGTDAADFDLSSSPE